MQKEIKDPENCCWGERIKGSPEIDHRPVYYWCSLNKTPCRYATRCQFEPKEKEEKE